MPSNKSFKQPAKNCHAVNLWNIQLKIVIYLSNTCARYNFQTLLSFFSFLFFLFSFFFFFLWQHFEHDFKSCAVKDWFPSERKYPAGDDLNRTTSYKWKHVQWSTFSSMQITLTRWNTTSKSAFASHGVWSAAQGYTRLHASKMQPAELWFVSSVRMFMTHRKRFVTRLSKTITWFKQKFIQDKIKIQRIVMCSSTSCSL